ncbi:MAG: TetR/AcrR family transcriptional regulator [Deltaproteobacteria bacterium]|nr:TetR/AcrR family transcriptional regulator [Deltaproteobacteria bacterium]
MPAPLMTREEVLDRLMAAFRKHGYDGASLAELSKRTGLGKSSLYHHFPGGKEQMAVEVLAHLDRTLRPVFASLSDGRPPDAKLAGLLDAVSAFYGDGKVACLLERLCASADRSRFARPLRASFASFMGAFEQLCREAGLPLAAARARAESAVVRIEGGLVVSAGTGDTGVFQRTLRDLRERLLRRDG